MSETKPQKVLRYRRLVLDFGPLALFFISYFVFHNIFTATAIFMAAVFTALGVGYSLERHLSPMAVFTAVVVLIFGGLTLYLKNDTFIKIKPTFLYASFGTILIGGLAFNRLFIKYAFADAFELTETGWRGLTWRWGIFFFVLAIVNELVWRNFSSDVWVAFKAWGFISLTFLFALAQTPLLLKHQIGDSKLESDG